MVSTPLSKDLRYQSVVVEKMNRVMHSRFVLALGSGDLEPEVFNTFMAQESIFRKECAKLYEIAENQITDTNVKRAFQQLKSTIVSQHPELKHDSHSESEAEAEAEGGSEAMSKYIAFIREMGQKGRALYILASIIPAMTVYGSIAQILEKFVGSNHIFTEWISTYSSADFNTSIKELESLFDKLIIIIRPTMKQVRDIFRVYNRSMRLVLDIFYGLKQPTGKLETPDLGPTLIPSYPDITLFCGFDLCATEKDTDSDSNIDEGWCSSLFMSTSALPSPFFRKLETPDQKQATANYEQYCVKVLRTASQQLNQTIESGVTAIIPIVRVAFSCENLQEGLQHLSNFEKEANDDLINSRLLKGLEEKHLERFVKHFEFESVACKMLLNKFGKRANVISSSWCGANILQEAFKGAVVSEDVAVYGNKLCFEQSRCTGAFERKIQSAMDKLQIFQDKVDGNCGLTIYIGDSLNDILCMIKADIGIIVEGVNPNSRLLTVGHKFGISFIPLYSGLLHSREMKSIIQANRSGVLYTVPNWEELDLILFGEPRESKSPKQPKKDEDTSDDDEDYLNDDDDKFKKKNDDDDHVFDDDDDEDRLDDHEIPWLDYDGEDSFDYDGEDEDPF